MTALYILLFAFVTLFLADILAAVANNTFLRRHMEVLSAQNELLKKHVDNIEKYIMESEDIDNEQTG